jgi:hypothetical protein
LQDAKPAASKPGIIIQINAAIPAQSKPGALGQSSN